MRKGLWVSLVIISFFVLSISCDLSVKYFSVTYNANGANSGRVPVDNGSFLKGSTFIVIGNVGNLAKNGYSFAGWNTKADGSGSTYQAGSTFTIATENVTLYAKWTISPAYMVTYDANGASEGSVPSDGNNYLQGATVTVSGNTGNLAKPGFTFAGWGTKVDGTGTTYASGNTFIMGAQNVTLYAKWTLRPTYKVTYEANGASGGSVPTDSNNYLQNATVTVLGNINNLEKTGYSMAGWNTKADGSGTTYQADNIFTMGPANVTLYAKWTALPTYKVTYEANGASGGSVPTDSNNYLQDATVAVLGNINNLEKAGYSMAGWNTKADGSGTTYQADNTFMMGVANVTLYAKWTALPTYKVTYEANGATSGSVPTDSNNYLQGASVTVFGNTENLIKAGYSFAGWNTKADGSGTTYASGNILMMGAVKIILYAKWIVLPTYKVLYNANGTWDDAPIDSNNYFPGAIASVLENPKNLLKYGYSFDGWNTKADGNGITYQAGDTLIMGNINITLYAKWKALPTYKVIYNSNGATGGSVPIDNTNYILGDNLTILGNTGNLLIPNRIFLAWNTAQDRSGTTYSANDGFCMGNKDLTLYAMWSLVVTYDGNGATSGSSPASPYNYFPNSVITVLGNTGKFTRTGYRYGGWNTKADGTGTTYFSGYSFLTNIDDVILYAVWVPN